MTTLLEGQSYQVTPVFAGALAGFLMDQVFYMYEIQVVLMRPRGTEAPAIQLRFSTVAQKAEITLRNYFYFTVNRMTNGEVIGIRLATASADGDPSMESVCTWGDMGEADDAESA